MPTAIKFENISKEYRLGLVSTQTLSHDLNRWWKMNIRGKDDPYLKIGEVNDRAHKGVSDYVWALRDINFEVQQGDVLGIIGKNGAGKSTLLKILSKVTAPTTGTIKARGRIASLLEVGTGFHPEMTGRENIFMNGAIMGMTKAEIKRKLDEIVDFSGVERYLDTPTKRYSSGMTVRLGFAIAAHLEPEILVVDEVLAVGDAEFQKKAIGKMQDISKGEGRTVLFVSHNMASVKKLCKTGIVLENGSIVFNGNIEQSVNFYISNTLKNKEYEYINNNWSSHKISKIYISSNGQKVYSIDSYDRLYFLNVDFEIKDPKGLEFGCTIFTLNGEPLISSQVFENFSEIVDNGKCKISIELPDSVLKQGEYYLEGAFWRSGEGTIESNDCFMRIKVEARNKMEIIGAGILGYIINPNNWLSQNGKDL